MILLCNCDLISCLSEQVLLQIFNQNMCNSLSGFAIMPRGLKFFKDNAFCVLLCNTDLFLYYNGLVLL